MQIINEMLLVKFWEKYSCCHTGQGNKKWVILINQNQYNVAAKAPNHKNRITKFHKRKPEGMLTLFFVPLYLRPVFMKWRQLIVHVVPWPSCNHVLLMIFVYASYAVTNNLLFLPRFEEQPFFKEIQGIKNIK